LCVRACVCACVHVCVCVCMRANIFLKSTRTDMHHQYFLVGGAPLSSVSLCRTFLVIKVLLSLCGKLFFPSLSFVCFSLSLSLTHTHTHTHMCGTHTNSKSGKAKTTCSLWFFFHIYTAQCMNLHIICRPMAQCTQTDSAA